MAKFIELHKVGDTPIPYIVNIDCIAYIRRSTNGTVITFKNSSNDVSAITVVETYEDLKNRLLSW